MECPSPASCQVPLPTHLLPTSGSSQGLPQHNLLFLRSPQRKAKALRDPKRRFTCKARWHFEALTATCVLFELYFKKQILVTLCNFVVQKPYPSQSVNCFGRFVYNSKKGRGSNASDIGGGYLHTGHSSPLTELQQDLLGIETSRYPIAVFPAIDHVVTWVLFIQGWDHHYLAAHLLGHQIWHRWVSLGSVQFAGSLHLVSEPPSGLWAKSSEDEVLKSWCSWICGALRTTSSQHAPVLHTRKFHQVLCWHAGLWY